MGDREKDPRKIRIIGLKKDITEDELKGAIGPLPDVGGDTKIAKVDIVPGPRGAYCFILFQDEASATAAWKALGEGKDFDFPELSSMGNIRVNFAEKRPPRPTVSVTEVARALKPAVIADLKADPAVRGAPGKDSKAVDVAAALKPAVIADLKADPAVRGAPGKDGKDSKAVDVAAVLQADDSFKLASMGLPGKNGKDARQWPSWVLVLLAATALVIASYAACGSPEDGTARSAATAAAETATAAEAQAYNAAKASRDAAETATTTQLAVSDLKKTLPDQITAAVNAAIEQADVPQAAPEEPTPEEPVLEPPPAATTPAPEPATPHTVGAVVIHNRFDKVEVRLDDVEQ